MESSYYFDEARNLIVIEKSGTVSVQEDIDLIRRIIADPKFRKGMNSLTDMVNCTYDWTLKDIDEMRTYVYSLPKEFGPRKWAFVSSGGVTQSSAKMFIMMHELRSADLKIRLFSSRFDAIKWLSSRD